VTLPAHIALNAVFLRPRMGGLETMVKRLVPAMRELAPDTRFSVFTGPQGVEALPRRLDGDRAAVRAASVAIALQGLVDRLV